MIKIKCCVAMVLLTLLLEGVVIACCNSFSLRLSFTVLFALALIAIELKTLDLYIENFEKE